MTDFIGKGWKCEPELVNGGVALLAGHEKIEQSIRIILETRLGDRVMRPTFGGEKLSELVFAPVAAETLGLAERYVDEFLRFWEPRIHLIEVHADFDRQDSARMNITIRYSVKISLDERTLVYPFYRIPSQNAGIN